MYIRMPYNNNDYFTWKLSELVSLNEKYKLFTKFHLRTPPKEILLIIFLQGIKTITNIFTIAAFSHLLFVEVLQVLLKDVANNYFIIVLQASDSLTTTLRLFLIFHLTQSCLNDFNRL